MNSRVGARLGRRSRNFWAKRAAALLLSFATSSAFSTAYAQAPRNDAGPGDPELVYVSKLQFELPIQVDPSKTSTIKELRLFVSVDKGRTWTQTKTALPTQSSFVFNAPSDGEYWLTLAFVDKKGRQIPADVKSEPPAQRIVVDTKQPKIDLQASRQRDGLTEINWRVDDDRPDPRSLKLELQEAGEKSWQELNINRTMIGSKSMPLEPGKSYKVRATVKDRAGNLGMQVSQITAEAPAADVFTGAPPAKRIQEIPTRRPAPDLGVDLTAADPRGEKDFTVPAPPNFGSSIPTTVNTNRNGQQPWDNIPTAYGDQAPNANTGRAPRNDFPKRNPTNDYTAQKPESNIADIQAAMERVRRPAARSAPVVTPKVEQEEPINEVLARMMTEKTPIANSTKQHPQTTEEDVPPPKAKDNPAKVVKIPLANSRSISVDYGVKNLGVAGIGKVELYYTMDMGQTWTNAGEDPDRMPPFEVELPKEGRYGLKVVVTNKAGFGQRAPQKGEAPQMLVEIDTTKPEAILYKPIPSTTTENAMLLSWNAKDEHMSEKGVCLLYAEDPRGQWQIIQHGLPKTGTYLWRLNDAIPYQVYLRIVAQDQAGNVAFADTESPIVVDLSKPEGEITNIATLPKAGDAKIR